MNPLVSIIIPVYNGSNYLKEAIDSALAQTYKNIEIIVVNDGSNDDGATEEIARSYGNKIKYYSKKNGGVATALNLGIKKMSGEYFSWLSHDDMYYPEKIEKQIKYINKLDNKSIIIISDWTIIDDKGNFVDTKVLNDRLEKYPMSFLAFDMNTWLNACSMLIPTFLFKKVGLFNAKLRTTQDYEMHLRMIKGGCKYKILHTPLLYSRVHGNQDSLLNSDAVINSDIIHELIINNLDNKEMVDYFNYNYSEIYFTSKRFLINGYSRTPALFIKKLYFAISEKSKSRLRNELGNLSNILCFNLIDRDDYINIASEKIKTNNSKITIKKIIKKIIKIIYNP